MLKKYFLTVSGVQAGDRAAECLGERPENPKQEEGGCDEEEGPSELCEETKVAGATLLKYRERAH